MTTTDATSHASSHVTHHVTQHVADSAHLLTVEQAADRLGTSVRFIRRLRHERRLTFIKLGRHLRIDREDLEAYIRSCREEIPAPRH